LSSHTQLDYLTDEQLRVGVANAKEDVYACQWSCCAFQNHLSKLSMQESEDLNEYDDPVGHKLVKNAFSAVTNNSTEMFEHNFWQWWNFSAWTRNLITNLQKKNKKDQSKEMLSAEKRTKCRKLAEVFVEHMHDNEYKICGKDKGICFHKKHLAILSAISFNLHW